MKIETGFGVDFEVINTNNWAESKSKVAVEITNHLAKLRRIE